MTLYMLSGTTCPKGWDKLSTDDGRYIYVTNSSLLDEDGAYTKQHYHTFTSTVNTYADSGGFYGAKLPYTANATINIKPTGIKMLLCKTLNYRVFPSGAILLSDSSTCPSGWSEYATGNSKYILFTETTANAGDSVSGLLGAHTHTLNCVNDRSLAGQPKGCTLPTASSNVLTAYTDLYHIKLMLCEKD